MTELTVHHTRDVIDHNSEECELFAYCFSVDICVRYVRLALIIANINYVFNYVL